MTVQLLTANDLLDGEIVYFADGDRWTKRLREARRLADKEEAESLLARAIADESRVVGPELAALATGPDDAADADPDAPRLARLRDAIRVEGPTTHPELGPAPSGKRCDPAGRSPFPSA